MFTSHASQMGLIGSPAWDLMSSHGGPNSFISFIGPASLSPSKPDIWACVLGLRVYYFKPNQCQTLTLIYLKFYHSSYSVIGLVSSLHISVTIICYTLSFTYKTFPSI